MQSDRLEEMKFHWDVWKSESKAFFGRTVLATPIIILSLLFQWEAISVDIPHVKVLAGTPLFALFVFSATCLLFLFLIFKFVDLLRHRVPEWMEERVHNNLLPNPLPIGPEEIDVKKYGRLLWLVFIVYMIFLTISFIATAIHLVVKYWH